MGFKDFVYNPGFLLYKLCQPPGGYWNYRIISDFQIVNISSPCKKWHPQKMNSVEIPGAVLLGILSFGCKRHKMSL